MTPPAKPVRLAVLVGLVATTLWTGCSSSNSVQPPSGLHYANNPVVYSVGKVITANTPSIGGGAVASYSVTPQVPAGLTLDPITGVLAGTPTAAAISVATVYAVTATNAGGSTSAGLTITVTAAVSPPAGLHYTSSPITYSVGTAIAPNGPISSGGAVASYSVSPPVPAGLNLDPISGVLTGMPTAAAVSAATTYTVTATNAGGHMSAGLTIAVTATPGPPTVLTYSTNPASYPVGQPITQNNPTVSGGAATSFSVTPSLPSNLSLNQTTGVITGAPAAVSGPTTYTVTATNGAAGSASVVLTIAVTGTVAPPTGITYSTNPANYTAGQAITQNTPTVSGGAATSFSVNPSLPPGLNLNTNTGVISGTPTAVAATASYAITASNTGGSAPPVLLPVNVLMGWGQLAVLVNKVPVTAPTATLSYTAVGSGPFLQKIKAQLYQSGGVTSATQAYINFQAPAGVSFIGTSGATATQCQVTSAIPECEVTAILPASTTASYDIQVTVAGAVTTQHTYNAITVVLNPDTTPGPGEIKLLSQAGNNLPYGFNAPVWVIWDKPANVGTVSVTLNIQGGATFYSFTPGNNTTPNTPAQETCTLNFTGSSTSQSALSCGFSVRATQPTGPSGTVGLTATATLTTSTGSYTYTVTPLSLALAPPQATTRTVNFVNGSSTPIFVGITGGAATSFVNPTTPLGSASGSQGNTKAGGGTLCGPSTTPPGVAACPIGSTCIQGGAGIDSTTTFFCYYDQGIPSNPANPGNGYLIAPGQSSVLAISGSSVSPQGIVWSGNFYARTACLPTGSCENATCVGPAAGFACGPGTGPSPGVNTLAEATFQTNGQPDYYDVSIINGANFAAQFYPASPAPSGYACATAGSTAAQSGPNSGANWTMNVSSANFPAHASLVGDPSSYYLMVSADATTPCSTPVPGCASVPGTVCGFRISDMTSTFDVSSRYCGRKLGWVTADAMYGFISSGVVPSSPFAFNQSPSGITVGALQLCTSPTYSSYDVNWPGPVIPVSQACGGVMWGPTESVNQNPAGNVGLGIINPAQQVQTANTDWLTYVLPTIQWLKLACPTCYTFPFDDMSSTFTCADSTGQGLNYTVRFSDLQ